MASNCTPRRLLMIGLGCWLGSLSACAHKAPVVAPLTPSDTLPPPPSESVEVRISKLQDRILDLETRISALNDKINLTQGVPPTPSGSASVEVVSTPPAHARMVPQDKAAPKTLPKKAAVAHPSAPASRHSFGGDPAVDRFREAKILFDTRRYPDAIVEFSDFIKNEPDHPLAPSAQYHLAMGYLEQKEYKLAEDEFNRVLLSYPHSGHVPDTLLALHRVSEALKKAPRALYFKEKLLSQFPNSPQARAFSGTRQAPAMEKPGSGFESSEEPKLIEKPVTPTAPEPPVHGDSAHS